MGGCSYWNNAKLEVFLFCCTCMSPESCIELGPGSYDYTLAANVQCIVIGVNTQLHVSDWVKWQSKFCLLIKSVHRAIGLIIGDVFRRETRWFSSAFCRQVAMAEIRDAEIRIDMMIMPVEEAYVMLNKYQMNFNDGNAERVDTISYGWKLLKQQVWVEY